MIFKIKEIALFNLGNTDYISIPCNIRVEVKKSLQELHEGNIVNIFFVEKGGKKKRNLELRKAKALVSRFPDTPFPRIYFLLKSNIFDVIGDPFQSHFRDFRNGKGDALYLSFTKNGSWESKFPSMRLYTHTRPHKNF